MTNTNEIQGWKISGWGLLRGLALLVSSWLAVTALHYLVLAVMRG